MYTLSSVNIEEFACGFDLLTVISQQYIILLGYFKM